MLVTHCNKRCIRAKQQMSVTKEVKCINKDLTLTFTYLAVFYAKDSQCTFFFINESLFEIDFPTETYNISYT